MSSAASPNPAPGSSPSPSPRKATVRRAPSKNRLGIIVGCAVALAVLALAGWKFGLPRIKVMRAKQFLAEAAVLERNEQFPEANGKFNAAVGFAPRDSDVLRAAAAFQARVGAPKAQQYFEMLLRSPGATTEDRKDYVKWALRQQRTDIAKREIKVLRKADPNSLELLHLEIEALKGGKEFGPATSLAAEALKINSEDVKSQFVLGELLTLNPDGASRARGRRILWGLALGTGEFSDRAADRLMAIRDLNKSELRLLIKDLQARTNQRPTDVLRVYDLRLRLDPDQTNAVVAEAFKTLSATNASTEVLAVFADWATAKGQPEVVLANLSPDVARTNRLLGPARAFALADAQRWSELTPVIDDKRYPLDPIVANVLRARMAMANQKESEAEAALKVALELQKKDFSLPHLALIVREAKRDGFPLVAISAYQMILTKPSSLFVSAATEILELLGTVDDMGLRRDTLKRLNEQVPGDNTWALERAWADLILNERIKESKVVAERLVKLGPSDVSPRFLLALALLREQKPAEALALIENDATNWEKLMPRFQALYVAALAANQQREAARAFARRVDPKYLTTPNKDAQYKMLYLKTPERDLIKSSL